MSDTTTIVHAAAKVGAAFRSVRPSPKLVILDLDGTILGGGYVPYARIPDHVAAFLDDLVDHGCNWALNSAWDIASQCDLIRVSALRSRPSFVIGELGRRMASLDDTRAVSVEPYSSQTNQLTVELAQQYMLPLISQVCRQYRPTRIHHYEHLLSIDLPEGDVELQQEVRRQCAAWPGVVVQQKAHQLKITLREITKGRAVREIIRLTGYTSDQLVAVGDESADIAMMGNDLAAHAICPANAEPALKEHVLKLNGVVGQEHNGSGVVKAFGRMAQRYGWDVVRQ